MTVGQREAGWADLCADPHGLEDLIREVFLSGKLEPLIALACEEILANEPILKVDPDRARHAGALAAIEAYAAWKRAEGRDVPIEILRPDPEPESIPLALLGRWVAWSSDGLRIVASARTLAEAERLAHEAGEPEPILEPHPGRARL